MSKARGKRYNDHICVVCEREFKSVRSFVWYCSPKCRNYSNTKSYYLNVALGIKIDPDLPKKQPFRRII